MLLLDLSALPAQGQQPYRGAAYETMGAICKEIRARGVEQVQFLRGPAVKALAHNDAIAAVWQVASAPMLRPDDRCKNFFTILLTVGGVPVAGISTVVDAMPHGLAAAVAACQWPGCAGQKPTDVLLPQILPPIYGLVATAFRLWVLPEWRLMGLGKRLNWLIHAALYYLNPHVDHIIGILPAGNQRHDSTTPDTGARGKGYRAAYHGYRHDDRRYPELLGADAIVHMAGADLRHWLVEMAGAA